MQDAENLTKTRHELDWDEEVRQALCGEHARKIQERDRGLHPSATGTGWIS